jgi:acyl-[acyl-carrier-protein]-phospholipid O-acyltransferase/long-chain-fatty-acid--[acyl-carrier-protein] ligase
MTAPNPEGGVASRPSDATFVLVTNRRFAPLLVTQMLTSFIDNLTKSASGVLMLFTLPESGPAMLALGSGIFMLPYVLGSSFAGEVADRFEKAWLLRVTQLIVLAIASCSCGALVTQNVTGQLLVLFALGLQATFFGPLKYGIIPELLEEHELVAGNGLIEAGTFIGIVSGTTVGAILVMAPHGTLAVGVLAITVAVGAVASAWRVVRGRPAAPMLPLRTNVLASTTDLVRQAFRIRPIRLSVAWLSWFWSLGLIVLSEIPVVAKDVLRGSDLTVTLLLGVFSVGVGIGSILCARLLHGEISTRHVPLAGVGLTLFIAAFAETARAIGATGTMQSPSVLLSAAAGWWLVGALLLLAICGGIFSVPLNALLQARAAPEARSRMVAANNVVNAVFMVLAAVLIAELARRGVTATLILWASAAVNMGVTLTTISFAWRGRPGLAGRLAALVGSGFARHRG